MLSLEPNDMQVKERFNLVGRHQPETFSGVQQFKSRLSVISVIARDGSRRIPDPVDLKIRAKPPSGRPDPCLLSPAPPPTRFADHMYDDHPPFSQGRVDDRDPRMANIWDPLV